MMIFVGVLRAVGIKRQWVVDDDMFWLIRQLLLRKLWR